MELTFNHAADYMEAKKQKLSICIATYKRGEYIGETLDSILSQLPSDVELVVVEGASPDDTHEVMAGYVQRHPQIRYFREQVNSGIDKDYDKAVGYARGEYCWLMTDDDLLRPGAINRVLETLSEQVDLVVVNSEVRTADFSNILLPNILPLSGEVKYTKATFEEFFSDAGSYLSFIGGVVIRRDLWMGRNRIDYYGTLFIHVGVIFQKMLDSVALIREPLIVIRYGNAMWTTRGFEIWMFKWPNLVWSFSDFSEQARSSITPSAPWRNMKNIFLFRAKGCYSRVEYAKYFHAQEICALSRFSAWLISRIPAGLANLIMVSRYRLKGASAKMLLVDLMNCKNVTWIARIIAGVR